MTRPAIPAREERIRDRALGLGFDAVGFARAELGDAARQGLAAFLADGHHGDMGWMAEKAGRRGDPRALWPAARSIVMLGASYAPEADPREMLARRDRGAISAYARRRDYHDVVKGRLKNLAGWMVASLGGEAKVFVDTAPVMEKPLAAAAGIGWQGKHTNLVSATHGSWLFLGAVFTTLELAPDAPHEDRCGSCTRCLDICPTKAFPAPYRLDARRCIAYLTIEHRGHIAREFRAAIGNRVFGCDDCLAACPWNKFAQASRDAALVAREALAGPGRAPLAGLAAAGFRPRFAGTPVKRTGRDRFLRNVMVAIGNSGDPALAEAARARLEDASPLVRAMAAWALSRLLPREEFDALRAEREPTEPDPDVRAEWQAG
ncbi:MAG: tRNA epoxyqueuosine(34) reductase QueG [Alphaproteobacteria bacterium]